MTSLDDGPSQQRGTKRNRNGTAKEHATNESSTCANVRADIYEEDSDLDDDCDDQASDDDLDADEDASDVDNDILIVTDQNPDTLPLEEVVNLKHPMLLDILSDRARTTSHLPTPCSRTPLTTPVPAVITDPTDEEWSNIMDSI